MQRRTVLPVAIVVLSGSLLCGCGGGRAPHVQHEATIAAPKTEPVEKPAKEETASDLPDEKAAQAHAHYAAAVIHEMNNEQQAALKEYYLAASNDLDNEALLLDVSRRFIQNKEPEKALQLLTRATAHPNASGAVYARLGLVYSQLGKFDQASNASKIAIKKAPTLLAGYQNLFLNHLQNKRPQEALKVLEDAGKQPHADLEFLTGLVELYGMYVVQLPSQKNLISPKALAILHRAEKLDTANAAVRMRLADGFAAFGDTGKAASIYLELLKSLPDVPMFRERLHAKLAGIYLRDSDRKKAVEQLQAMVRDDPTNPQTYYYLGYLAYADKKPGEAAEYYSKALLLNPDFEDAYYDLALAQISLDKSEEALETLGKARKKFAQNFVLELWTGLAYARQKDYAKAIVHYTAAEVIAKATEPTRLTQDFYFQLGAAYERTQDYVQAEKCFEQCLKMAPDFAEAENYLGYMWAERGVKLQQARELIEKAVKAQPKNAAYLDSLGWVLFKLNQPNEALSQMLKAVEFSEEPDSTLYDHLGDIYSALGHREKAREAWAKSLSLESNEEVRKKLEASPGQKVPVNSGKSEH